MINLFENYNEASRDLHHSLIQAGYQWPTIVLKDEGFLPQEVQSPYQFFMGEEDKSAKALYFNELPMDPFWEISGDNSKAQVKDLGQLKAQIYYADPKEQRLINKVDWLDEQGRVAFVDLYNQFGRHFSRIAFDMAGGMSMQTYYDTMGREVIVHNLVTAAVSLAYQDKNYFFKDLIDFFCFYLKASGLDLSELLMNSLGLPFLVSHRLNLEGEDILFWQEPITDEIPGNMQLIFNGGTGRAKRVITDDLGNYERLHQLMDAQGISSIDDKLDHLGYIYPLEQPMSPANEALILTNTDQVESLEYIVKMLPEWEFHVGAITEMSDKLMNLDSYDNLHLYPNISKDRVAELFKRCNCYLDINYSIEIYNAVRQAFNHSQMILGFNETLHQPRYIAPGHRFSAKHSVNLVGLMQTLAQDQEERDRALAVQLSYAGQTTVADYQRVLG
ncbi:MULTISPECIES: accessory Sec system glycosylation chaperone GtfB [Aerococcus]|uniref:accessory Sec system glycosylation chaperone GtfB n=1 Tax=Aerococcus urinae (strain CCUG 59500 / ACS-120-V-Col10a) TaxID=2976812 RepID=UPI000200E45F|nr:accessory Sec system glycosylation chaperone GtfB [Aerococcus sp. Group 1]AEA00388.1 accessory Sec system glycosyltransferase GtfB [Aerococcus sp. Group 1]MCY3031108.1 accessory Sec system glycosylation chaperone GtfB [Aerococcus sp. Group 1]MCY3054256.1 accessory Sec system glycosylation chaperone GtfB [Aerococcus sp. Group 1]MCY3055986.1 accessory Sec system glycosylation chaperone GtfB [Aerococcus sp. Group 1]MCY3061868.1 accessory Sec system glycosylation chaperone GtfB [Aerococcus sp. 